MLDRNIPNVVFKTRVRGKSGSGVKSFRWLDVNTDEYFADKKVVIVSLPGAFTPTCSKDQLPDFEKLAKRFRDKGIDAIYCISVNDAYVMNAWGKDLKIKNVVLIPDGSGEFTRKMGMLVHKNPEGFGLRSWRYAAVVNNKVIEHWFEEPGFSDNCSDDPYGVSSPANILSLI